MPLDVQREKPSLYLGFKVALRSSEYQFAIENLEALAHGSDGNYNFLYAAVLETQQSGMRSVAVAALQTLLDRQPPGVHLPTLLRCTVRIMMGELQAQERVTLETLEEVTQLFEKAAGNINLIQEQSEHHRRLESQWWSKNAYNLALRVHGLIDPEVVVRLLLVCVAFIEADLADLQEPEGKDTLKHRKGLCHFIIATSLITGGRSIEAGEQQRLDKFSRAREHIESFRSTYDQEPDTDTTGRLFELLKLDLECILRLQQWEGLSTALKRCLDFPTVNDDRWGTLAELIFAIHQVHGAFTPEMSMLLQRIIASVWNDDKDPIRVARWIRLSFQIDLSRNSNAITGSDDGAFALQLLSHATRLAQNGYDRAKSQYPDAELQWLATTAFNHGVDLLSAGAFGDMATWMQAARELAQWAADGGSLARNLDFKWAVAKERVGDLGKS